MTIQEMIERKREKGYTCAQIAELSGVPLGTVQKIFSGNTTTPGYDTMRALNECFSRLREEHILKEQAAYAVHTDGGYTVDDYRSLPDDQRVELIDGRFYVMEAPAYIHQRVAGEIHRQIANFIVEQGGACHPVISPVDVQLDCDEKTMLQPDVAILCDTDKVRRWGIYGAPEFVLEVISPSTKKKDCTKKVAKYAEAGVKEYWILDPYQKRLIIYRFETMEFPVICGLDEPVPIMLYDGKLKIQFEQILNWINEAGQVAAGV